MNRRSFIQVFGFIPFVLCMSGRAAAKLVKDHNRGYSQEAVQKINILIRCIKNKICRDDESVDVNVFCADEWVNFIEEATSQFNQIPPLSNLGPESYDRLKCLMHENNAYYYLSSFIIEYACYLARQAYSTKNDNHICPTPSKEEMLGSKYSDAVKNWFLKIKTTKVEAISC